MKRIYALLTLLGILSYSVAQEPAIITVGADGLEQSYQLSLAQDIVFTGTQQHRTMQLTLSNGAQIDGITTVLFGQMDIDIPTSITPTENARVYVYPNPVASTLYVNGVPDETLLKVYNLSGQCVQTDTGNSIWVQNLPQGTYLLQINNQIVKFIKTN